MTKRLTTENAETAPSVQSQPANELSRRAVVQLLGSGLLVTVTGPVTLGQRRRGSRGARSIDSGRSGRVARECCDHPTGYG